MCGVKTHHDDAAAAVGYAASLARRLATKLVLVHVTPNPFVTPRTSPVSTEIRMHVAELARRCGAEDAEIRAEVGATPAHGLRRVASDLHADMIVIGSRGHGPWAAALTGSTTAELARESPCPIVVVPPDSSDT